MRILKFLLIAAFLTFMAAATLLTLNLILDRQKEVERKLRYFDESFDAIPPSYGVLQWTNAQPDGRALTNDGKVDLNTKYTEAWQAFAKGFEVGNIEQIAGYFTGSAYERAQYALETMGDIDTNMVFLGMTANPILFHLDASYVQIEADDAIFVRYGIKDKKLVHFSMSKECVLDNLFQKSTGWKIADHERSCSQPISYERLLKFDRAFPTLKGINYYPKDTPWNAFWKEYSSAIVKEDMRRLKTMGANSVRVFLPTGLFIDPKQKELDDEDIDILANLEDFLKLTKEQNISVIPTLFDFRGELSSWTWSNDRVYLNNVLPILNKAKNIAYIDLKNELDLDFGLQNPALGEAWGKMVLGLAREIAPHKRYSIGWAKAENAKILANELDVISYHDYENIDGVSDRLTKVREIAGKKPVVVSEIGATSYELLRGIPSDPTKQAQMLKDRLNALRDADGVLVWTMYDYAVLDPKAVQGSFWHKGIQQNFGLFDYQGRAKGAYKTFKEWIN